MPNMHIEVINRKGSLHLAEITLDHAEKALFDALQRAHDERGQRWFPPDANALTTSTVWLTVDDDEPYRDGCTNSERAEAWVRDGHSFMNGRNMVSDPDIESVLVLNYTDIVNFGEMIGCDTPVLDGVIALMRAWYERPDIINVRVLTW